MGAFFVLLKLYRSVAGDAADSATRRLARVSGLRVMHGEWLAQGVRAMAAFGHP
jgi:hypothetical protein